MGDLKRGIFPMRQPHRPIGRGCQAASGQKGTRTRMMSRGHIDGTSPATVRYRILLGGAGVHRWNALSPAAVAVTFPPLFSRTLLLIAAAAAVVATCSTRTRTVEVVA